MSIRVRLSWFEYHLAVFCGSLRIVECERQSAKGHLDKKDRREENDIQAAGAEIAVAKALNQYWCGGVNRFRLPDVGHNIEVRRTKYGNGHLMIRPDDVDNRPFVLVRGAIPEFEIVGWIHGGDGKQDCWKADPNKYGEAFMVPAEALKGLEALDDNAAN